MVERIGIKSAFAACFLIGLTGASRAESLPAVVAPANATPAAPTCLADVRAFSDEMRTGGYWLGGSSYGYGYPVGGVVRGDNNPPGDTSEAAARDYVNARPGYEVRNLIASANILARNGQQQPCEEVLAMTRAIYQRYIADLRGRGMTTAAAPSARERQIAAAQPVENNANAFRSDQLLDTEVRNTDQQSLGSVHDLVMSPRSGRIAYLVIARGGLFGIGQKYVPVPWSDFKVTQNVSFLVLDTTTAIMDMAPEVADDRFATAGLFDQESQKVDSYWKTNILNKAPN